MIILLVGCPQPIHWKVYGIGSPKKISKDFKSMGGASMNTKLKTIDFMTGFNIMSFARKQAES
jgi:hypothetical protein